MGQKTHPIGFRLGITKDWSSRWFTQKDYKNFLKEDINIRRYVDQRFKYEGISKVQIERTPKRIVLTIYTSRPGIIIGKKGTTINRLRNELKLTSGKDITINVLEVKQPELDAQLVAESIARQIKSRVAHRRAMKRAITSTMRMGAKGVKILCKGRLGGREIARSEWYMEGRVPLHTLRADIDYGYVGANTMSGTIGVKVWIYKGDKEVLINQ